MCEEAVGLERAEPTSTSGLSNYKGRFRQRGPIVVKALRAIPDGMPTGGGLNDAFGEQGGDTPAVALLGGAPVLGVVRVWRRKSPPYQRSMGFESIPRDSKKLFGIN